MTMVGDETKVGILELRRLLYEIKDNRPDICVRLRLIGEMWQRNHHRIIEVTEKGVVLAEDHTNKLTMVRELTHVMQFELEKPFHNFQPHFHYYVDPRLSEVNLKAGT